MKIISPEQHDFTPGREITDSIIMAIETIHSMHSSKAKGMIIKLDVSKAYDRVSWNFLFEVLKKFGFKQKWLDCIKHCVSSVNYFVIVNGTMSGFFQATNGLRQGDPLSLFLFVLMAEVLGRSIKFSVGQGAWKGISIKGYMEPVSHLQFVDDTILFGEASKREALIIKKGVVRI
ncbi:secreted RxLR effector protein 78-like [Cryptomeria japonica]|uniref:secreted RxLR effector protein 78-like n=1 Tax=Cryptomeria japonica TaxID=3369 RepID=UPI0027DA1900|nr:secreted RxLR effector protein 78-like [Cryptomeria japonica]